MKKRTINPKSIGVEALFFPNTFEQTLEVRRKVIASGHTANFASALVVWLVLKSENLPDGLTSPTRSSYRRALARLEPPRWRARVAGEPPNTARGIQAA